MLFVAASAVEARNIYAPESYDQYQSRRTIEHNQQRRYNDQQRQMQQLQQQQHKMYMQQSIDSYEIQKQLKEMNDR